MKNSHLGTALQYRKKLERKSSSTLEGIDEGAGNSFNASEVNDRLENSKQGLYNLIETYFDDDKKLKKIADEILQQGGDPLRAVANDDDTYLNDNPDSTGLLEVIVQTDGSRPSFLIRNNKVEYDSSPLGDWDDKLVVSANDLNDAIQCVGRININQRQIGTGFLVKRNLIVTNRHVLQAIGRQQQNREWTINPGAYIDFGYEFKGLSSVNPREIEKVVYCGPQLIDGQHIDHSKLDFALLQLETVPDEMVPLRLLNWNDSKEWASPETGIYIIGYPGDPGLSGIATYTASLLDKLFKQTYGCKRLAPGKVLPAGSTNQPMTVSHDATTLGGNSGSLILTIADGRRASGLHYGGELAAPRQNWGHILGYVLSEIQQTDPAVYNLI